MDGGAAHGVDDDASETVTVATHVGCEKCRHPSFVKVQLFD